MANENILDMDEAELIGLIEAAEKRLAEISPIDDAHTFYKLLTQELYKRFQVDQVKGCMKPWRLMKKGKITNFRNAYVRMLKKLSKYNISNPVFMAKLIRMSPYLGVEFHLKFDDILLSMNEAHEVLDYSYGAYIGSEAMKLLQGQVESLTT